MYKKIPEEIRKVFKDRKIHDEKTMGKMLCAYYGHEISQLGDVLHNMELYGYATTKKFLELWLDNPTNPFMKKQTVPVLGSSQNKINKTVIPEVKPPKKLPFLQKIWYTIFPPQKKPPSNVKDADHFMPDNVKEFMKKLKLSFVPDKKGLWCESRLTFFLAAYSYCIAHHEKLKIEYDFKGKILMADDTKNNTLIFILPPKDPRPSMNMIQRIIQTHPNKNIKIAIPLNWHNIHWLGLVCEFSTPTKNNKFERCEVKMYDSAINKETSQIKINQEKINLYENSAQEYCAPHATEFNFKIICASQLNNYNACGDLLSYCLLHLAFSTNQTSECLPSFELKKIHNENKIHIPKAYI